MIKKILSIFIYLSILFIVQMSITECLGEEVGTISNTQSIQITKINSINFDNSDSIIFLGTSGSNDGDFKITKKVLTEPDRVFFDIENAVITFPNSTYELKNSRLSKLKIAQNSVNPNVVRIVIWNANNYNPSQIKLLKIKNNIIIKLSNEIPSQKYLTQIYKETKESSAEYYDKAQAIPESSPVTESDEIFNKVQQAFNKQDEQLVRPNIEQKQARLKSRYFLENIRLQNGNIFISGIGVINIEKPFILREPNRLVIDLPNTIVLQELRDKEIKLTESESVKIGQFEPSKARLVINTPFPDAYIPIYTTNLQTIIIANRNNLSNLTIAGGPTELTYFKEQNVNETTDVVNITFSNPIIYSLSTTGNKTNVIFYNLTNLNTSQFNQISDNNNSGIEAKQLSQNAYSLTFTSSGKTLTDCYETLNGCQLRFVFTKEQLKEIPQISLPKPQSTVTNNRTISKDSPFADLMARQKEISKEKKKLRKKNPAIAKIRNRVIVIDAGHGGNDTGAMRGNVLEKDITLDIALKLREILLDKGFNKVIMTRSGDTTLSLAQRVELANSNKADIYVSIHINASVKNEIHGIETHYYTQQGYEAAKVIHNAIKENVKAEDRGLFKSKFYVINHTEAPAVLLELGFISNNTERDALLSKKRQEDSAKAIAEGIIKFLSEHRNE